MSFQIRQEIFINHEDKVALRVPIEDIAQNGDIIVSFDEVVIPGVLSCHNVMAYPPKEVFKTEEEAIYKRIDDYKELVHTRQDVVILSISAGTHPNKESKDYHCMLEALRQRKMEIE